VAWRELSARHQVASGEAPRGANPPLGSSLASVVRHGLADPSLMAPATQVTRLPAVVPLRSY
jgi:hypothetical protein